MVVVALFMIVFALLTVVTVMMVVGNTFGGGHTVGGHTAIYRLISLRMQAIGDRLVPRFELSEDDDQTPHKHTLPANFVACWAVAV